MKKNAFFLCFYSITFLVLIINAVFLFCDNAFVNINDVPKGEYQKSYFSNDHKTELKVYVVKTEIGNGVRITRTKHNKTENIYWQANQEKVKIYWIDNNTVLINNVRLDLLKGETYDCRNAGAIFNDGLTGWN